uniref:Pancreatic progenitor cell differentiation and proliferation factor n=1 Tax=Sus scrofa TaxID=9823 RepID=A0A8W4F7X1_PIG
MDGSCLLERLTRGPHNYYQCHLGSTSRNSSCGSAKYPAEADPGTWWASFFFGKSTFPFMAIVLESPEHQEPAQASTGTISPDLAWEPGKTNCRPLSSAATTSCQAFFQGSRLIRGPPLSFLRLNRLQPEEARLGSLIAK